MIERISNRQFYNLMLVYIISSDIIRGLYAETLKNDIWIPNITGILISILLFTLYMFIFKNNKYDNFSNSLKHILGKIFIKVFAFIYIIYFMSIAFFTVVDLNELVSTHLLPNYPLLSLAFISKLVVAYLLLKNIEVVARLCEILGIMIFMIFLFLCFSSFALYDLKLNNLLPFLQSGLKPIIKISLEMGYAVPYGELFVFILLYENIEKKEKVTSVGNLAIFTSGIIFTVVTLLNLFILGPYPMAIGLSPVIRLARTIDIEEYVQRLDLLLISFHVLLSLIKTYILIYASGRLLKEIVNINEKQLKISYFVMIVILFILIVFLERTYTKILLFRKDIYIKYINIIFEVFIPLVIVLISFFRKSKKIYSPEQLLEYTI